MKIDFQWETFYEDDCSWEALFVSINDAPWHLAKAHYNTEDQEHIIEIITANDSGDW